MFRWCAYCWRFLGEREPLTDYAPTHGICPDCEARDALTDPQAVARTRPIAELHAAMVEVAQGDSDDEVHALLQRGRALGIRPLDMMVGVLQPALYELGRLWSLGALDPATEARFSRFCEDALQDMQLDQARRLGPLAGAPILLVAAEGNHHTIGVRMVAFALREARRDARVVLPTPDVPKLGQLCALLRPSVLGISVALPDQVGHVARAAEAIEALGLPTRVVAGGFGLRAVEALPRGVAHWSRLEDILEAEARQAPADVTG